MAAQPNHITQLVDHLFRHESGKMVAVLSRLLGLQHLETAQDIVQDTLLQAMTSWSYKGLPDNPPAWLYRVARNKAIDYLRREKKFHEISPQYAYLLQSEWTSAATMNTLFLENEIEDSQLRMMFACCHPAISEESQIALVLKTLCGLSVAEIAKAYLTSEDAITKRIYRAKERIRSEKIDLEAPQGNELPARLEAVLQSLYLLFNEGYNSSHPDRLIRDELCEEALRLCGLLLGNPLTALPRTSALMALMCFQASRLSARLDENDNIILLKFQDRTTWNRDLIEKGFHYIETAANGPEITPWHLEAGIASLHAAASSFDQTDWKSIYHLYDVLYQLQPGPVIALNKAIASSYAISRENALRELLSIRGLEQYYLYYASAGEICFELNKPAEAKQYFQKALGLTSSISEQQLLMKKISLCNRQH